MAVFGHSVREDADKLCGRGVHVPPTAALSPGPGAYDPVLWVKKVREPYSMRKRRPHSAGLVSGRPTMSPPGAYLGPNVVGDLFDVGCRSSNVMFRPETREKFQGRRTPKLVTSVTTVDRFPARHGQDRFHLGPGTYVGVDPFGEKAARHSMRPSTFPSTRRHISYATSSPGPQVYYPNVTSLVRGGGTACNMLRRMKHAAARADRGNEATAAKLAPLGVGQGMQITLATYRSSIRTAPAAFCSPGFGTSDRFRAPRGTFQPGPDRYDHASSFNTRARPKSAGSTGQRRNAPASARKAAAARAAKDTKATETANTGQPAHAVATLQGLDERQLWTRMFGSHGPDTRPVAPTQPPRPASAQPSKRRRLPLRRGPHVDQPGHWSP